MRTEGDEDCKQLVTPLVVAMLNERLVGMVRPIRGHCC